MWKFKRTCLAIVDENEACSQKDSVTNRPCDRLLAPVYVLYCIAQRVMKLCDRSIKMTRRDYRAWTYMCMHDRKGWSDVRSTESNLAWEAGETLENVSVRTLNSLNVLTIDARVTSYSEFCMLKTPNRFFVIPSKDKSKRHFKVSKIPNLYRAGLSGHIRSSPIKSTSCYWKKSGKNIKPSRTKDMTSQQMTMQNF